MPDTAEIDRRCPECECVRTTLTRVTVFFGSNVEVRHCDFCHHRFRVTIVKPKDPAMQSAKAAAYEHDPDAPVAYHSEAVRCCCPFCQARNPPVQRTMKPDAGRVVRYHQCAACQRSFRSEEAAT